MSSYLPSSRIRKWTVIPLRWQILKQTTIFLSMCVLVTQSCLSLCDPRDCSPPGSSVHGIFQARILEWIPIPFSKGVFLTQTSNPGLLHCRQILYHLSHQGSPTMFLKTFANSQRGRTIKKFLDINEVYFGNQLIWKGSTSEWLEDLSNNFVLRGGCLEVTETMITFQEFPANIYNTTKCINIPDLHLSINWQFFLFINSTTKHCAKY